MLQQDLTGILTAFRSEGSQWALTHYIEPKSRSIRMVTEGKKRSLRELKRRQMIDRLKGKTWFGVPLIDQFDLRCLDEPIWEK